MESSPSVTGSELPRLWKTPFFSHLGDNMNAYFVVLVQTPHLSDHLASLQMSWQPPGAHQQLHPALPKSELAQTVLFTAVAHKFQATDLSLHDLPSKHSI